MDFKLRPHTILLTRAGSRAYGIATKESDIDLKGIAVPPLRYFLGIEKFEQADSPEHFVAFTDLLSSDEQRLVRGGMKVEGSVYDIRKFCALAADANPNILDILFCDEDDVLFMSKEGKVLRDSREAFLSTKCKHTFSRYAMAQMKRIRTHRRWLLNPPTVAPTLAEYRLPHPDSKAADSLKAAQSMVKKKMDQWNVDLSFIEEGSVRFQILEQMQTTMAEIIAGYDEDKKWTAAVQHLGFDTNFQHYLDRARQYAARKADWDSYQSWLKNRNPARAALEAKHLYDTKHGAHLVRLMRMCEEVLTTGRVNVNRAKIDGDELRAIRAGSWSYERLEEFALETDEYLTFLYRNTSSPLPRAPDRYVINRLSACAALGALRL